MHPRTLFGEFDPIQQALASGLRELNAFRFGFLEPRGLIHLVPHFDGGYTQVELRAFREAGEGAGIRWPFLLDNRYGPLSDGQLQPIIEAAGAAPVGSR
jgi:hypothetical protein